MTTYKVHVHNEPIPHQRQSPQEFTGIARVTLDYGRLELFPADSALPIVFLPGEFHRIQTFEERGRG